MICVYKKTEREWYVSWHVYIYMTSLNVMLVGYGVELKCFRQTCYSAHLNCGIL